MPPVNISLPSELLTFLAVVAVLWTIASVLVVFLAMLGMLREGARRADVADVEHRVSKQHREYVSEARMSRDRLTATVGTLSQDVHTLMGKMDRESGIIRGRNHPTAHRPCCKTTESQ